MKFMLVIYNDPQLQGALPQAETDAIDIATVRRRVGA